MLLAFLHPLLDNAAISVLSISFFFELLSFFKHPSSNHLQLHDAVLHVSFLRFVISISTTLCFAYTTSCILVDLVRAQIQSIHCYYCASPMPPQTDDYEKHVAKLFFSKLFSLPPISDNCNDATPDALFKLNKQTCKNSNCTKITVTTEGKF
ncbi:hypothetical protein T08_15292 [Trichinella sp. T8]|nr:hypothetical protein T08_15292 [Trichinella sp. T8]